MRTVRTGAVSHGKATVGRRCSAPLGGMVPLVAGQEAGRSCFFLKYTFAPHAVQLCILHLPCKNRKFSKQVRTVTCRGKTVLLDCSIHPSFSGVNSLTFFDKIDLDTVDAVLITHFHLEHCADVPCMVDNTAFKARKSLYTDACLAVKHNLLRVHAPPLETTSDGFSAFKLRHSVLRWLLSAAATGAQNSLLCTCALESA